MARLEVAALAVLRNVSSVMQLDLTERVEARQRQLLGRQQGRQSERAEGVVLAVFLALRGVGNGAVAGAGHLATSLKLIIKGKEACLPGQVSD